MKLLRLPARWPSRFWPSPSRGGGLRADADVAAPPTASPPATRTSPAIAANRNGDVAVVWEDDRDATDPGRQRTQRDLPAPVPRRRVGLRAEALRRRHRRDRPGGTSARTWASTTRATRSSSGPTTRTATASTTSRTGWSRRPARCSPRAGPTPAPTGSRSAPKVAVDPDGAPGTPARSRSPWCGRTSRAPVRPRSGRPGTPAPPPRRTRWRSTPAGRRAPPAGRGGLGLR